MNPDLIKPLPFKDISLTEEEAGRKRIIFFNPKEVYNRVGHLIDPYARRQSKLHVGNVFPKTQDRKCDCGCGKKLPKRRSRWATDECSRFAGIICSILSGDNDQIYWFLYKYNGGEFCNHCKRDHNRIYSEDVEYLPLTDYKQNTRVLSVDHVLAVRNGGSGGWLGNYQLLCGKCHVIKTKKDLQELL